MARCISNMYAVNLNEINNHTSNYLPYMIVEKSMNNDCLRMGGSEFILSDFQQ